VVFFDAEDVGGLDGNPFAAGAAWFVGHYPREQLGAAPPSEVIVLDMVGGRDMVLDVDAHLLHHPPSLELTARVFQAGGRGGYPPFLRFREKRPRAIISDHFPFLSRGIASCLLIDLDYPEWHTGADLPEAMSEDSLEAIAATLRRLLSPPPG
jgi:glutaminyl-peptide cyclotransferase